MRNAGEVADAVHAIRADVEERAQQAELETVRLEGERQQAELRAIEQRKRRKVQLALATVVVLVAVGSGTYLDELLTLGGGENIGEASRQTWPRLSLEYLMAVGPQVILDGQMGSERLVPSTFWARYPSIPAVREDRVRGYPIDLMLHPGPRIASALDVIARLIHPEAFSQSRREIESGAADDQMMRRTKGRASQPEQTSVEERM